MFQKKNECSLDAHRFKSLVSIKFFTCNIITKMGIQDKNTKNSIKSKNYHTSKTLREFENFILIDWYIVIKPCSEKRISEKMSVNSIQNYPPQQTLKLSLVRLKALSTDQKLNLFRSF